VNDTVWLGASVTEVGEMVTVIGVVTRCVFDSDSGLAARPTTDVSMSAGVRILVNELLPSGS
jgi:hypothetical protein